MKKLVKGLREFKANYYSTHRELFEQLSHGQKPRVLFITCSDSRVDPNLITQAGVGELFVIRNAGNNRVGTERTFKYHYLRVSLSLSPNEA